MRLLVCQVLLNIFKYILGILKYITIQITFLPLRGEHEGGRRMKTELLVQMDGLARSNDLVFVLAASNLPWCAGENTLLLSHCRLIHCRSIFKPLLLGFGLRELDHAMLRRLEKRILVGLPSSPARKAMINHWLPPVSNTGGVELRTELAYDVLAEVCHMNI